MLLYQPPCPPSPDNLFEQIKASIVTIFDYINCRYETLIVGLPNVLFTMVHIESEPIMC